MSTVWRQGELLPTATGRPASALATLVHEEYDPIVLPPGTYWVRRRRGYTRQASVRVAG